MAWNCFQLVMFTSSWIQVKDVPKELIDTDETRSTYYKDYYNVYVLVKEKDPKTLTVQLMMTATRYGTKEKKVAFPVVEVPCLGYHKVAHAWGEDRSNSMLRDTVEKMYNKLTKKGAEVNGTK